MIAFDDIICARATAAGHGAISVIRISGSGCLDVLDRSFRPADGAPLRDTPGYRVRFGAFYGQDVSETGPRPEDLIDEVLVTVFRAPRSYTGEDSAEISCHGSEFIVQSILQRLTATGARLAEGGEFTRRAFLNGKLDLAQAEAVADVIASETAAAHRVAIRQLKGGFSDELALLRASLVDLVSLMELELDFSEEEVEFADRTQLLETVSRLQDHLRRLTESFALGNAIKNGVPVAIAGATNTGKSTLLNALLGEERAIVSDIHGTTRDTIEETLNIDGITFRFIDTAGIRSTTETIEIIGIERTYRKIRQAAVVLMVLDAQRPEYFQESLANLASRIDPAQQQVIVLLNKVDTVEDEAASAHLETLRSACTGTGLSPAAVLPLAAKSRLGIDALKQALSRSQSSLRHTADATLVTNLRHYQALREALDSLERVQEGLEMNIATDLVAQDIRETIHHIGSITGDITSDEILGNIFGRFCIGK